MEGEVVALAPPGAATLAGTRGRGDGGVLLEKGRGAGV